MAAKKKGMALRRRPVQARSRDKVSWLLEAAVQVFRAEGYGATTNRIAQRAGVSIGTLYEYFPNKEALLLALAERHVEQAEGGIRAALQERDVGVLLAALQRAILASQRYPSTVLGVIADPRDRARLKSRVATLRQEILATLSERARRAGLAHPQLHARIAFGLIGELTSQTFYEADYEPDHHRLAEHLLELALHDFGVRAPDPADRAACRAWHARRLAASCQLEHGSTALHREARES